jgi:hypothetical protein
MPLSRAQEMQAAVEARIAAAGKNLVQPDAVSLPVFKRSDLKDSTFYAANEAAILAAVKRGDVIDDISPYQRDAGKSFGDHS